MQLLPFLRAALSRLRCSLRDLTAETVKLFATALSASDFVEFFLQSKLIQRSDRKTQKQGRFACREAGVVRDDGGQHVTIRGDARARGRGEGRQPFQIAQANPNRPHPDRRLIFQDMDGRVANGHRLIVIGLWRECVRQRGNVYRGGQWRTAAGSERVRLQWCRKGM